MFDCIVVGAGAAGSTAAYHLAKQGHRILLLEKASLPRYKACGGGVSPAIAQWFDFDLTPAIALKVKTIRYTWKLGDPVEAKLPIEMWMVQRDVFDQFLVQQGQQQGVEVKDNTPVTGIKFQTDHWQITTSAGTFAGRYLIAADGATGPLAKWLGFKERQLRPSLVLEVSGLAQPPAQVAFEFGMVKNGYIWNFPKPDGYTISVSNFRSNDAKTLKQSLIDYANQQGIDLSQSQQHEHWLGLWDGNQPLHTQNALLAGEAACVVDPLTAEGIRPSIWTGVKAAEAVSQALAGDNGALANYTQTVHQEWGADMVWAQRLAGLFYRVPGIAYKVGVKRPRASQLMAKILCGELRYGDIANEAIKRLSSSLIPGMGG